MSDTSTVSVYIYTEFDISDKWLAKLEYNEYGLTQADSPDDADYIVEIVVPGSKRVMKPTGIHPDFIISKTIKYDDMTGLPLHSYITAQDMVLMTIRDMIDKHMLTFELYNSRKVFEMKLVESTSIPIRDNGKIAMKALQNRVSIYVKPTHMIELVVHIKPYGFWWKRYSDDDPYIKQDVFKIPIVAIDRSVSIPISFSDHDSMQFYELKISKV